jgi:hypothetical protein
VHAAVDAAAEPVVHVAVDVGLVVLVEPRPHVLEDEAVRVHRDDEIGVVLDLDHAPHGLREWPAVREDVHLVGLQVFLGEIQREVARPLTDGAEHQGHFLHRSVSVVPD